VPSVASVQSQRCGTRPVLLPPLLLLSHGNYFALFRSGNTALHLAALHGQLDVCRLLIESKAHVSAKNRFRHPGAHRHFSLTPWLVTEAAAVLHSDLPEKMAEKMSLSIFKAYVVEYLCSLK
jgi:hypothetical protein